MKGGKNLLGGDGGHFVVPRDEGLDRQPLKEADVVELESGKVINEKVQSLATSSKLYMKIVLLTLAWWFTSSMFSVYSKRLFNFSKEEEVGRLVAFTTGTFVTFIQFAGAGGVYFVFLLFHKPKEHLFTLVPKCWRVGVLYLAGNLCTNLTLALISVSKTQTYKVAEPLFVIFALRLVDHDKCRKQVSPLAGLWIVLIIAGVGIASYSPPFSPLAMQFAFAANIFFGFANVYVKASQEQTQASVIDIYGASCVIATLLGIVLVGIVSLLVSTDITFYSIQVCSRDGNAILSSFSYFLYNLFSFVVLGYVVSSTHAVLKVGKRIASLVVAGVYLDEEMDSQQWFGIWVALLGIILYGETKNGVLNTNLALRQSIAVTCLLVFGIGVRNM